MDFLRPNMLHILIGLSEDHQDMYICITIHQRAINNLVIVSIRNTIITHYKYPLAYDSFHHRTAVIYQNHQRTEGFIEPHLTVVI